ncbi:FMRFamide neuropeptides [Sabethes cyaneus]|uniref:FMRFamide neuropeptides n=1 Tax=Sabethes cyaneus TaxID=53552 RepID=UPI00237DCEB9|nr:FMRFamide neuropeptides [Sabethes cyaneus]
MAVLEADSENQCFCNNVNAKVGCYWCLATTALLAADAEEAPLSDYPPPGLLAGCCMLSGAPDCSLYSIKMYLFLAILVYKCSSYFSCAEYDPTDRNQAETDPSIPFRYEQDMGGDYPNENGNGLVFEFRRSIKSDNTEIEARRRSALDKNFMRFGRADPNLQRVSRASKQANLMRFGRADRGFLRFGRLPNDVPYSLVHYEDLNHQTNKDSPEDDSQEDVPSKRTPNSSEETGVSESSEQLKPKQLVYYRRDSPKNLMRFGKRDPDERFVRYDRANLMRFGRAGTGNAVPRAGNLLRFGRANGNLMRFGRSKGNLMRFGRSDPHFLRLIKMDNNFMRFGRSGKMAANVTNSNGTAAADFPALAANEDGSKRVTEYSRIASENSPSNSDEDYEIHLREEDILAPMYVVNN